MKKLADLMQEDKVIRYSIFSLLVICLVGIVWLYVQVTLLSQFIFLNNQDITITEELQSRLEEIQWLYDNNYINESDKDTIIDTTLAGFVFGHEDKYGYYLPPAGAQEAEDDRKEKLFGIGVEGRLESDNGFYIVRAMEDSPAEEVGLKRGDIITGVNGLDLSKSESSEDFLEELNSRDDKTATLTIKTASGEQQEVEVQLRDVRQTSAYYTMLDDVCYVRIKQFTEYTDDEFIEILDKTSKEGTGKYIFDLRQNTGGLADTVVKMIDYIVPEGLIVDFVDKNGKKVETYMSDENEFNAEMVIITDENTASASELFTQTLRDYDKATVVGTNTFGKGTVVSTYQLKDGGTITISTARYHTKSGYEIEGNGIKPDIEIDLTDEEKSIFYKLEPENDTQVKKALEVLGK